VKNPTQYEVPIIFVTCEKLIAARVLWMQGKINVVVGFVYKKFNKEIGGELARTTTFFNDFLGICGSLTYGGTFSAPYSSRGREVLSMEGTPSQSGKKKTKVLPREFYEALVEAVACPPQHKGTSHYFLSL
jgi:hypothetical protein